MFALKVWMIFATWAGGYEAPKETIGYFTTQAECNIHGWEMTKRDQFQVWECEPENF